MSETLIPDDAASQASPGELLRKEREAQGLTLEEVANSLNLRPAVVQGLEDDQYDEVPVAAYRRGYLRAYAGLLGIDDRPVLEAYRRYQGTDETERKVTPVNVTRPPSRLGPWLFRLVTLLVIAGLIGLTLMWWQSRGGNEPPDVGSNEADSVAVDRMDEDTEADRDDTATTEPAGTGSDDLPPAPEGDEEMGLVDDPAATGRLPGDEVDPGPAHLLASTEPAEGEPTTGEDGTLVQPDQAEEVAATDSSGEDAAEEAPPEEEGTEQEATGGGDDRNLELTFNEQSWTEIFDADDERVLVGLQEPGTTASVEGEPPFRLTVGNATGVELRWGGEPVDLEARAGANNVARFTLGD